MAPGMHAKTVSHASYFSCHTATLPKMADNDNDDSIDHRIRL